MKYFKRIDWTSVFAIGPSRRRFRFQPNIYSDVKNIVNECSPEYSRANGCRAVTNRIHSGSFIALLHISGRIFFIAA